MAIGNSDSVLVARVSRLLQQYAQCLCLWMPFLSARLQASSVTNYYWYKITWNWPIRRCAVALKLHITKSIYMNLFVLVLHATSRRITSLPPPNQWGRPLWSRIQIEQYVRCLPCLSVCLSVRAITLKRNDLWHRYLSLVHLDSV